MTNRYLLGIDSGTSVVKVVVFDQHGREVALARGEMQVVAPQMNHSETEMIAAWEVVADTIAAAVAQVGGDSIAAVGFSGTACGFWAIDEAGRPVRSAILWNDGRASDVITRWQADGVFSQVFNISGNAMFPGFPLATLRWLQDHEPVSLERARWFLFHKDWLRYNLTGAIHTDQTDVAYFPGDIRGRGYSAELLDLVGLGAYHDRLPPVVEPHQVVGEVSASAAARTGLRAGTPVVAGAVDVIASALGGGTYRTGQACAILGTAFLNSIVVDEPSFTPHDSGINAAMPGGVWLRSLANMAGTMNITWLVDELAGEERAAAQAGGGDVFALMEQKIRDIPVGSNGVLYLPYLSPGGINAPIAEPNARAIFFGMSAENTRADLMRAVYEGIALAMRDCFACVGSPFDDVTLVGGGARSAFWTQMFADSAGKRMVIVEGSEFGARGAAILAGVGTGIFESFDAAMAATIRPVRVYEPDPARAAVYEQLYELYYLLSRTSRDAWRLRRQIADEVGRLHS
jgi:sugar (pentulose or hexulose) kinase